MTVGKTQVRTQGRMKGSANSDVCLYLPTKLLWTQLLWNISVSSFPKGSYCPRTEAWQICPFLYTSISAF